MNLENTFNCIPQQYKHVRLFKDQIFHLPEQNRLQFLHQFNIQIKYNMGKRDREQIKKKVQSESEQEVEENEAQQQQDTIDIRLSLQQKILQIKDSTKVPFMALRTVLLEQQKLDQQRDNEIKLLFQKYQALSQPLVAKTREIVQGKCTDNTLLQNNVLLTAAETAKGLAGLTIPGYWYNVLMNSEIGDLISQQDHQPLKKLINLILKYDEPSQLLEIQMQFQQNDLFANKTLRTTLQKKNPESVVQTTDKIQFKGKHDQRDDSSDENYMFFNLFKQFYQKHLPYTTYLYFGLRDQPLDGDIPYQGFEEDSEEQQEESVEVKKSKKVKTEGKKIEKTTSATEKPECKQQ